MAAKAICPHCQAAFAIKKPEYIGKKIKCPKCAEPFVVKVEAASSDANAGRAASNAKAGKAKAAPVASVVEDDFDDDFDYDFESERPLAPKKKKSVGATGSAGNGDDKVASKQGKTKGNGKGKAKGKAKSKSKGNSGGNKFIVAAAVGIPVVILAGVIAFMTMPGGGDAPPQAAVAEPAPAPVAMKDTQAPEGLYTVTHPQNWQAESGGGTGGVPTWIRLTGDDASISIRESPSGGAVGDMAQAGGAQFEEDLPEELAPVQAVHEFLLIKAQETFDNYEETEPVKIMTGMGDSRISEFTGSEGVFSGTVYGYRATLLSGPRQLSVIAKCSSKKQWEKMKPLLHEVILSIK